MNILCVIELKTYLIQNVDEDDVCCILSIIILNSTLCISEHNLCPRSAFVIIILLIGFILEFVSSSSDSFQLK